MKKSLFVLLFSLTAFTLQAETVKLKNGRLISGSILSQSEYTLNIATSYGEVSLNQKEVEQILPDKYRVFLKGGTQLIGIILDLDEFNVKLQTDDGVVNVDVPQIVNMQVYDYDQAGAEKEFVEEKREQQRAQQEQASLGTALPAAAAVSAAGGLSFDSDIDKVFDAKKPQVIDGQVVTPAYNSGSGYATPSALGTAQPFTGARMPTSDEQAFLKGSKTGTVSAQEYASAARQELAVKKPVPQKKGDKTKEYREQDFNKYLSIDVGAMPLGLTLDNSKRSGSEKQDVGGTSIIAGGKFLWRVKNSNFWLGPVLSISSVANKSFFDADPNVTSYRQEQIALGNPDPFPNPKVKTSGQIINLGLASNFYINPKGRFVFYLTGSVGYEMLSLNYRGELFSESLSSNGVSFSGGAGVETRLDDLLIGLEVRQLFAQRTGELKASSSSNTVATVKVSWKF